MKPRKPTMTDVARAAGVSQTAVSMILSEKGNHSFAPATVEKVHAAAKELGYILRSAPTASSSRFIMVISVNGTNPYYTTMVQSVERKAYQHQYQVLTCHSYRDPNLELQYLELAAKMKVAGLIVLYYPHCLEKIHEIAKTTPVVCVCDQEEGLAVDIVEMQHAPAGKLLIDHLVDLGHKKIALITSDLSENRGRMAFMDGLRVQMERRGLADSFIVHMASAHPMAEMEDANADYNVGYNLMQDESIYLSGATAFVCTNDSMALGVIDALLERGYKIPDDFSVCGSDNLLYSDLNSISMTTIDHRMEVKGQSAMDLLLQKIHMMHNTDHPSTMDDRHTIKYQPLLVVRQSTGPAPFSE